MDNIKHIENFLKKFKKITPPDDFIKKQIIKSIDKKTGIKINNKQITYKNNIIYIKTKQEERSFIFLNKEKIIEDLKKTLKNKTPKDIK